MLSASAELPRDVQSRRRTQIVVKETIRTVDVDTGSNANDEGPAMGPCHPGS